MKFTEGGCRDWGYELAQKEFGAQLIDGGPWCKFKNPKTGREIIVKDSIADAFLQQILLRPAEYDVIATLNLNGDYIRSEARLVGKECVRTCRSRGAPDHLKQQREQTSNAQGK